MNIIMLELLNQILISVIIVLGVLIWVKIIYKKETNEDIINEFKKWKGEKENFIKFKIYQYDQSFKLVFGLTPFITFAFGLIIGSLDKEISILGVLPSITLLLCFVYLFKKYMNLLNKSSEESIQNMRILLENF
ncbi:MAG: hypothetical protein PHH54_02570 [Candidatus Nanoarchaeia archaeon]|nr:hypothetical protein [Candidatus Nanoarchaeia archaeon]MDD5740845.1 hypothetical protein [Candidatus Nanoarchaeia archaeon]